MHMYHFANVAERGMIFRDGIAFGYSNNNIISNLDTHTHDYYEMTYMCDGEAVQIINDKPHYVHKGSLIILSPNDNHSHHSLTKIVPLNCSFQSTKALSYLPNADAFPIVLELDEYFQQQIEHLFYLLMVEIKNDRSQHAKAEWNFLDSIFLLVSRNLTNSQQNLTSAMEQILSYTINHLQDIKFSDAAQIYGTSEGNFCRMFKKNFNMTFTEFVTNLRIEQAKKLLLNTQHKIEFIYKQCGYNNSRPFFMDFKKRCGVTPHQFRKQNKSLPQTEYLPPSGKDGLFLPKN